MLAAAANVVGAWFAAVFAYWNGHYFVLGRRLRAGLGVLLLIPLVIIALARIEEIAAIAFGRKPRRLIAARRRWRPRRPRRKSRSISRPITSRRKCSSRRSMRSRGSIIRISNACVVINNTPDPAFWQPIEEHCRALGERFKFVNADKLQGFKAGALRLAMEHTAADAEIIGIIDADYVVQPDWLKDLVPVFADPRVGLVQAPQDHRDGERSVMHHVMNGEYAGFFDIGMVQRNEANAIIVHGTMCLIRRAAMEAAGGWSSDTICEDTDLGLTLLEHGWLAHYTNRRYGHGLLPDTFEAFKKQRHRWAYGGFQIVKKHWRRFLPGASRLTPRPEARIRARLAQLARRRKSRRRWSPSSISSGCRSSPSLDIAIPDRFSRMPIIASFIVSLVHFVTLYRLRVRGGKGQLTGAMFAAMSVQWTVARAVGFGLIKDHLPFVRTAKGGLRRSDGFPRVLGGGDRRAAAARRGRAGRHQHQGSARNQYLRRRAGGAEPAVPRGGRARPVRAHAAQRFRHLAHARGAPRRAYRPAAGTHPGTGTGHQTHRAGAVGRVLITEIGKQRVGQCQLWVRKRKQPAPRRVGTNA